MKQWVGQQTQDDGREHRDRPIRNDVIFNNKIGDLTYFESPRLIAKLIMFIIVGKQ